MQQAAKHIGLFCALKGHSNPLAPSIPSPPFNPTFTPPNPRIRIA